MWHKDWGSEVEDAWPSMMAGRALVLGWYPGTSFHCWELELGRAPADPLIHVDTFQVVMTVLSVSSPRKPCWDMGERRCVGLMEGRLGTAGQKSWEKWVQIVSHGEGRVRQDPPGVPSSLLAWPCFIFQGSPQSLFFFCRERCSSSWKELSIPLTPNSPLLWPPQMQSPSLVPCPLPSTHFSLPWFLDFSSHGTFQILTGSMSLFIWFWSISTRRNLHRSRQGFVSLCCCSNPSTYTVSYS